jgi:hypothetical protein
MAITSGQITVTTTRIAVDTSSADRFTLHVHNGSATNNIFLGGNDVTAATGLELHSHETKVFEMMPGDTLYAISSSGSHDMSWMKID